MSQQKLGPEIRIYWTISEGITSYAESSWNTWETKTCSETILPSETKPYET